MHATVVPSSAGVCEPTLNHPVYAQHEKSNSEQQGHGQPTAVALLTHNHMLPAFRPQLLSVHLQFCPVACKQGTAVL